MQLILINNSTDTFTYASGGVVVSPSSQLNVTSDQWFALYTDQNFIKDVRLQNILVNDGTNTMALADAEAYVKFINEFQYNNKDTDGALIVRNKAAKKGWSFWAVPVEITTSTIDGVFCEMSDGTSIPWITCKIYDNSDVEITDAANVGNCVKTVVDFEPTFDFEIIGGSLRTNSNPALDVRMWIVGAPDIPAMYGGSKEFASGINLKFLAPDSSFEIDGRVTKYLQYNATTHQGKMRILFKHPAGTQMNLQLLIHLYRQ